MDIAYKSLCIFILPLQFVSDNISVMWDGIIMHAMTAHSASSTVF